MWAAENDVAVFLSTGTPVLRRGLRVFQCGLENGSCFAEVRCVVVGEGGERRLGRIGRVSRNLRGDRVCKSVVFTAMSNVPCLKVSVQVCNARCLNLLLSTRNKLKGSDFYDIIDP